ncbi:MAG: Succinate-semialdehyde dehydrogenase [NAD]; Succinate-semialdehyde dehydrogenase [NADP+], partial [uncultured Blastococcus sp.]
DSDAEPPHRAPEDRQRHRRTALRHGQPLHRRDGEGVPLHRDHGDRRDHRAGPHRLPGVAEPPGRGARGRRPAGRRADGRAPRRPGRPDHHGDGQAPPGGLRRAAAVRHDPQVLRRQRPRLPRTDDHRAADGQGRGGRGDQADRRPAGHRAVELPLLPGGPRGGAEPGAGQHRHPQARRDHAPVRRGDRAAVHRCRRTRRRLHQHVPAHRRRGAGHRRPAHPGGDADRQRARGQRRRRPRRQAPEEVGARARRQRPVHRAGRRQHGRHGQGRHHGPDAEHRPGLHGVQAADRHRGALRAVRRGAQAGVLRLRPGRSGRPGDLPRPAVQRAGRTGPARADPGRRGQGRHRRRRWQAPRPRGGVRGGDDPHRRHPGDARLPRGAVRSRGRRLQGQGRRRGGRPGQRQRLRPGGHRHEQRPRPGTGGGRAARGRHGVDQPAHRLLPRAALRRGQAVRLRSRAVRAGHVRVRQPAARAHRPGEEGRQAPGGL